MSVTAYIQITPASHDSNNIRFLDEKGFQIGFGYQAKGGDQRVGLIRCPKCGVENYAMSVSSGICYQCGFDASSIPLQVDLNSVEDWEETNAN